MNKLPKIFLRSTTNTKTLLNQTQRFYGAPAGSFLKKEEVTERVINLIKQHPRLSVAPETINGESHFANDLKLDSLDTTEIVMEIEDEFVIEIPDKEAYSFNTVGEVVTYVSQHPMAK
eukprot:gene3846-7006_t